MNYPAMNYPVGQKTVTKEPDIPIEEFKTILLLDGWDFEILQITKAHRLLEFRKDNSMIRVDTSHPNHLQYGYWHALPMSSGGSVDYYRRAKAVLKAAKIWT